MKVHFQVCFSVFFIGNPDPREFATYDEAFEYARLDVNKKYYREILIIEYRDNKPYIYASVMNSKALPSDGV
jgi:hypothetical protein